MGSNFIDTKIAEAEAICKRLGCDNFDDCLKKLEQKTAGKNNKSQQSYTQQP